MQTLYFDDYGSLSREACTDLIRFMSLRKEPLLTVASGDSPAGLYRELRAHVNQGDVDVSSWHFLGLDEWVGLNANDQGSCRFHVNKDLFLPLGVKENHIFFFDGRKPNLDEECQAAESFIKNHGGMDVAILGLGLNGHIGMNEPHTPASLRSHVTTLDPITTKTGQKYFEKQQSLSRGITLGIQTILDATTLFLLVSGSKKAAIVKQVLEGEISEEVPGSLLRRHPGLRVYLDKEAAAMLEKTGGS